MKRTRLKPMSAKRVSEVEQRRQVVDTVIRRDGACTARQRVPAVECWGPLAGHEPLPRSRGGDYLDPEQVIALCAAHHQWVHEHPNAARVVGLLQ